MLKLLRRRPSEEGCQQSATTPVPAARCVVIRMCAHMRIMLVSNTQSGASAKDQGYPAAWYMNKAIIELLHQPLLSPARSEQTRPASVCLQCAASRHLLKDWRVQWPFRHCPGTTGWMWQPRQQGRHQKRRHRSDWSCTPAWTCVVPLQIRSCSRHSKLWPVKAWYRWNSCNLQYTTGHESEDQER